MVTDRDKTVAGDPHQMVLAQKHLSYQSSV